MGYFQKNKLKKYSLVAALSAVTVTMSTTAISCFNLNQNVNNQDRQQNNQTRLNQNTGV